MTTKELAASYFGVPHLTNSQEERHLERRKLVGKRVKSLREAKGWSQDTLAHASGLNRSYPYRIEEGLVDVRLGTLLRISEALEVDVIDLLQSSQS